MPPKLIYGNAKETLENTTHLKYDVIKFISTYEILSYLNETLC